MKQFCLALMIALLGTTSAYAVSLNWSSMSLNAGTNTSINFTAGTNFSVALVFSANDLPSNTSKLLAISYAAKGASETYEQTGVSLDVRTNGDVYGRGFGRANDYKASPSITFGTLTGTNVLGIAVTFATNSTDSAKYDVTYTVYLNDTEVHTSTHSGVDNTADDFKYVRTGLNNTTLYYATGTADGAAFAALPEPTVLALLALGVAGVALRRKAA